MRSRVRLHRNAGSREKRKKRVQVNQKADKRLAKRCNRGASEAATRISACAHSRSAASRAGMAGWAGEGGGRFGERREYEAPTLPSTPRQHGSARHHNSQARNGMPPHTPGQNENCWAHALHINHSAKSRAKKVSALRFFKKALWYFSAIKKYLKTEKMPRTRP